MTEQAKYKTYSTDVTQRYAIKTVNLVTPADNTTRNGGGRQNTSLLTSIIKHQTAEAADIDAIKLINPDLAIVIETLQHSILSPKDLQDVKLSFKINPLYAEITDLLKDHFTSEFNLEELLPTIVEEGLISKGSYAMMIISPNLIQKIIKSTTVSLEGFDTAIDKLVIDEDILKLGLGCLKVNTVPNLSLESYDDNAAKRVEYIHITDNVMYAGLPELRKRMSLINTNKLMIHSYGMEDSTLLESSNMVEKKKLTPSEVDAIYKPRSVIINPDYTIPEHTHDLTEHAKLNPIVIHCPHESLIVIHTPGSPKDHIGYLCFLDEKGFPITASMTTSSYKQMDTSLNNMITTQTFSVNGANNFSEGSSRFSVNKYNGSNDTTEIAKLSQDNTAKMAEYYSIFEKELHTAIENGVNDNSIVFNRPDDLFKIMLFRQLQKMTTRIMYIPKKLMTYIAYNYDSNGVGQSLLSKTKFYGGLRATLTVASVMAAIKQSIPKTLVSIDMDEREINPEVVIEQIMSRQLQQRSTGMNFNAVEPSDIVDNVLNAGYVYDINPGSHMPGVKISESESNSVVQPPDPAFIELTRNMQYMALWTVPADVDQPQIAETATSVSSRSLIEARRRKAAQAITINKCSDFVQSYIKCGGPLLNKIKVVWDKINSEVSDENKESVLTLRDLIKSIELTLPKPDESVLEAQSKAYGVYKEFITEAVDCFVTKELLQDMKLVGQGDIETALESFKQMVLTDCLRNYLRYQNMLPELFEIFDPESNSLTDRLATYSGNLEKLIVDTILSLSERTKEDDKTFTDAKSEAEPEEEHGDDGNEEGDPNEGDSTSDAEDDSNKDGGEDADGILDKALNADFGDEESMSDESDMDNTPEEKATDGKDTTVEEESDEKDSEKDDTTPTKKDEPKDKPVKDTETEKDTVSIDADKETDTKEKPVSKEIDKEKPTEPDKKEDGDDEDKKQDTEDEKDNDKDSDSDKEKDKTDDKKDSKKKDDKSSEDDDDEKDIDDLTKGIK
jgi:hypothetical protein